MKVSQHQRRPATGRLNDTGEDDTLVERGACVIPWGRPKWAIGQLMIGGVANDWTADCEDVVVVGGGQ